MEMAIERARVFLLVDHVEVDVGRVAPAELRDDRRGPERRAARAVANQEDEFAFALRHLAAKALLAVLEQPPHVIAIIR